MREAKPTLTERLVETAHLPEEGIEHFMFIDLSDARGWPELESALPEGAVDDLTGAVV